MWNITSESAMSSVEHRSLLVRVPLLLCILWPVPKYHWHTSPPVENLRLFQSRITLSHWQTLLCLTTHHHLNLTRSWSQLVLHTQRHTRSNSRSLMPLQWAVFWMLQNLWRYVNQWFQVLFLISPSRPLPLIGYYGVTARKCATMKGERQPWNPDCGP